jgi:hypothetical protein
MKFQPGQSGNPAGRPPGSLNRKTLALAAAYEAKAEEAANDVMERAKSGDPAAMRLCMERAAPAGRHRRFAFALPRIRTPEDAEAAIDVVMDGLAEGVLSLPEVAAARRAAAADGREHSGNEKGARLHRAPPVSAGASG